ncbi:MAG: primosomal protein N' [Bacteroidota bacterium]
MPTFALVSLPVGLDREFTYLIPSSLEGQLRIGVRVIVPFGRQVATGLVVGITTETDVRGLKEVREVVDPTPIMTEELVSLCRWVASYYLAPLGEVLRTAVPHGFTATSKRLVLPAPLLTRETLQEAARSSRKRTLLLTALLDRGSILSTNLQKITGIKNILPLLRELEREGLIETEDVLPRAKLKARTERVVLLKDLAPEKIAAARGLLSARKKNAALLLDTVTELLREHVEEIPARLLFARAHVPPATLKDLSAAGVLPVTDREVTRAFDYGTDERTRHLVLNEDQRHVYEAITGAIAAGQLTTFLLHGVTGSGKTQVYIEAIRSCLEKGKSAIVLVPEIALTPQIVRRFKTHFGDLVGVVHSRMSPGERHDVWRLARRNEIRVVIGPRSAIFAPLNSIGLIVVDEEHESSYKQYDAVPRYHARDVAIVRGMRMNAVVVLGSATPSAESYHNTMTGRYTLLNMTKRIDDVPMPEITIVDMTAERKRQYVAQRALRKKEERQQPFVFLPSSVSSILQEKITDRLLRHEGIILLQNRRGFAPIVECPDCGYAERCENCSVTLTYHQAKHHLRCHYCGLVREPHGQCPQCGGTNLHMLGVGTQRVEEDLHRLFPDAKVIRMDMDTTSRRGAHDRILRQFESGQADILLGTQMVAKGLDFARVTLVGVISADTQMLLPDFRSSERTFQLLTQVAGRAGRSVLKGEVIIQTYQPSHYTLQHVVDHNFETYFSEELVSRKELHYPPFSRLILIEMRGKNAQRVQKLAEDFGGYLKREKEAFTTLGPTPALIDRINGEYRWHIIVKSIKEYDQTGSVARHVVRDAVRALESKYRDVKLIVDVDPVSLM